MNNRGSTDKALVVIVLIVATQLLLTGLYLFDLLSSIFSFRSAPLEWQSRELLELSAAIGLLLGVIFGLVLLLRYRRRLETVNSSLRVASDAFSDLVKEEFAEWSLSPKEGDVAYLMLKGLSNAEISAISNKKEGTVKAQVNAVLRKSGYANRTQFAGHFIEVLMQEPLVQADPLCNDDKAD